jgi:hypothetical protein
MKKRLKKIYPILIVFFIFWGISELGLCLYTKLSTGEFKTAETLYRQGFRSYFNISSPNDCGWGESIGPHQFIGYIYHDKAECQASFRNNFGFRGSDVPDVYDPNFYSIMLLGGSVAEQLGSIPSDKTNLVNLEKYLNTHYISPNKKPFKVLNFSLAGGRQPMGVIVAEQFLDRVDSVVSVEGYNEQGYLALSAPLETAGAPWQEIAAAYEAPFTFLALKKATGWSRKIYLSSLKQSYVLYYVLHAAVKNLSESYFATEKTVDPYKRSGEKISNEQRRTYVLNGYVNHLEHIRALADYHHKTFTLFLQPNPNYFKTLTPEEKIAITDLEVKYQEFPGIYEYVKKNAKINTESLEDIFQNVSSTLYIDHIHTNNQGVEMLSAAVADRLGKRYHWAKKPE